MPVRSLLMLAPTGGEGGWTALIPLVVMLGIFYFLLIRPMRQRQKQQEEMVRNLKNGDKVVTSGGIYGTITGIRDDRVTLRVADQVKIDVTKNSIAGLQESEKS